MRHQLSESFVKHFETIDDSRRQAGVRHPLIEVLFIAICAIIAGADDWVAIEHFGHAKKSWFSRYLVLKHGIPSHDTFGDVFGALDPEQFIEAFISWMRMIATVSNVIALIPAPLFLLITAVVASENREGATLELPLALCRRAC